MTSLRYVYSMVKSTTKDSVSLILVHDDLDFLVLNNVSFKKADDNVPNKYIVDAKSLRTLFCF